MAGPPSWLDAGPNGYTAWDSATLDGVTVPGACSVDIPRKGTGLELYKPPGQAGHSVRDVGHENAKITLTVRMWEAGQLDALAALYAKLRPGPKQSARRPLSFYHPNAQLLGITRVYLMAIGGVTVEKDGVAVAKIELLELAATRQAGVKRAVVEPSLKGTPVAIAVPGVPSSPAKPSATEAKPSKPR